MSELTAICNNIRGVIVQISTSLIMIVLTFCGLLFIAGRDSAAWRQIWNAFKGALLIGAAPAIAAIFLKIARIG